MLDLLFPKYCVRCKTLGSYLCPNCFTYLSFDTTSICLVCGKGSTDSLTHPNCRGKYKIDGAFSSIVYEGIAKQLLYIFKYKPFVTDIQALLGDLFYEGLIQKELFAKVFQDNAMLVPIPLHKSRLRKRGYNQAAILAKKLSQKLGVPVAELLERAKNTKSQITLSLEERKSNIDGAFLMKNVSNQNRQDANIFLVDDVLTTGSTLAEAATVLKRNGYKKVYGITLARGK